LVGAVAALTGAAERAISDLERAAADRRRFTLERARREPEFASLHAHPRFRALVGS
jgi:hypothetical protein